MKKTALLLALLLCTELAQAADDDGAKVLIQSCAEVEAIYNRRGEKNLFAGINTSVAEALRAGYCKGVLEQYRRSSSCYQTDWVKQAEKIAQESASKPSSVSRLLSKSCG